MTNQRLLSILVPVYNEEEFLAASVHRALAAPLPEGLTSEVVAVDDGSTDCSREILAELAAQYPDRVRVIHHQQNAGKGAAIRTALENAHGEFGIIQDADLEYDPQDYVRLLQPIREDRADVVYGVRFKSPNAAPLISYLFNTSITRLSNLFTGLNLSDIETCYKVFPRRFLAQLDLREDRFGFDPEFTSKLAGIACRVDEVAVSYTRRSYREGKKIGLRDAFRALFCVITYPPRRSGRLARRVGGT